MHAQAWRNWGGVAAPGMAEGMEGVGTLKLSWTAGRLSGGQQNSSRQQPQPQPAGVPPTSLMPPVLSCSAILSSHSASGTWASCSMLLMRSSEPCRQQVAGGRWQVGVARRQQAGGELRGSRANCC
jgi:hypothetical protein